MAIIDFHSHILPGIDDGSKSLEMTLEMLRAAAAQGTAVMAATPHFYAGSMTLDHFLEKRRRALEQLESPDLSGLPRIIPGAEVAFFPGMGSAEAMEQLCLAGTELLLVEMPFGPWSDRVLREIAALLDRGLQPVIAHLERFIPLQADKGMIDALMDMPVYGQVNAECLLSWRGRRLALPLFRSGYAQLLGSDSHNTTTRPVNLAQGRDVLRKKLGQDALAEMDALGARLIGLQP